MTGSIVAIIGLLVMVIATLWMNTVRPDRKQQHQHFLQLALVLGVALGVGLCALLAVKSVLACIAFAIGGAAILALISSTATRQ